MDFSADVLVAPPPADVGTGWGDALDWDPAVWLGGLAARALHVEAELTTKPGLADTLNRGVNRDLSVELLSLGADALAPWFVTLARLGERGTGWPDIQACGRAAETATLGATGGIATHRGVLFALGWLCVAAGQCLAEDVPLTVKILTGRVSYLVRPVLRQWLAQPWRAAPGGTAIAPECGQRILATYGLTGLRGEVAAGFATVRQHGLPAYQAALERGWSETDALLWALIGLMAHNDDTSLVARGGLAGLRRVQGWAGRVAMTQPSPEALRAALTEADTCFRRARLCPAGSAHLLAVTWWLVQVTRPMPACGLASSPPIP